MRVVFYIKARLQRSRDGRAERAKVAGLAGKLFIFAQLIGALGDVRRVALEALCAKSALCAKTAAPLTASMSVVMRAARATKTPPKPSEYRKA